jgi:pyruvate dehydrogenase E2 component (dihydrolipoamide acetyltransferase)
MAELIAMPKLGFDMQEGTLVAWLKQPGDTVAKGDILAEIETDKATVEVEAFVEGTLLQLLVDENTILPIGAPIAVIGAPGEEVDLAALGVAEGAEASVAASEPASDGGPPAPEVPVPSAVPDANGRGLPDGVRASPLARRIAQESGINLAQVQGSGPQGRIVKADVEAFLAGGAPAAPAPATRPAPLVAVPTGPDTEEIPTSRMRKLIGERMVQSKTTVPHFYVTTEIDMQAALDLRAQINAGLADEDKVSVNDMVVKAVALTLRQFPNLNSSFNGDTIVRHNHVNVGIAVALDEGLMNVVSKDADVTPLTVMAPINREMIARAREGKVRPDDIEGETFTVSNLGPFDVDHFIAIINPPAAGIVAVGSARKIPVVDENGELTVGLRMKATISADHRVTDGAEAARFMQHVKQVLEDPLRLMM